jgi:hypothetical protein
MNLKVIGLLTMFLMTSAAMAEDPIHLQHRIIGVNHLNKEIQLHVEFTITNTSNHDLHDLSFLPEGIEFSGIPENNKFRLRSLPANGSTTLTWVARSFLAEHYFTHDTPLFFLLEATHNNHTEIRLPVVSSDEGV